MINISWWREENVLNVDEWEKVKVMVMDFLLEFEGNINRWL